MSFKEMSEYADTVGGSEGPVRGFNPGIERSFINLDEEARKKSDTKIAVRYRMIDIDDAVGCRELEQIMAKSLECGGNLKEVGDIVVIREDSHFARDGSYLVAVKYYEVQADPKTKAKKDKEVIAKIHIEGDSGYLAEDPAGEPVSTDEEPPTPPAINNNQSAEVPKHDF